MPTPSQGFHLHVDQRVEGDAVIVRAVGEVDMLSVPLLAEQLALAAEVAKPPGPVVADLREVVFFGSNGISALLVAQDECKQRDVTLRVLGTRVVTHPLDVTGASAALTICPTLTDALRSDDLVR
jgi:anti-sigma B factor antagonist